MRQNINYGARTKKRFKNRSKKQVHKFGDKRLEKRFNQIEEKMQKKSIAILNQISDTHSDYIGNCRFFQNEKITWQEIHRENEKELNDKIAGKHLLVLNDTTEINYEKHRKYLNQSDPELGPVGNNKDIGFFLHPGYVIDSETEVALGFSYIKIWNRKWNKKDKNERDYKNQAIEEKESYRWIECALTSKEVLKAAKGVTVIADRESDIYEEFAMVPDDRTDVIIRLKGNRLLSETNHRLFEFITGLDVKFTYKLLVRGTKTRQQRNTEIEVKYSKVKIQKPKKRKIDKDIPESVEIYVLEAKEKAQYVPEGEEPIHWKLATTHIVSNNEEAIQIIKWYAMRWQIELLFTTLKSTGLNIEASQLETGKALKAMCVMAMYASFTINQLRMFRDDKTGIPASILFTKDEITLIEKLVTKYEGKTEKQKNPYRVKTISWASWLIARLGGWKGYSSESPPGNKTFKWGLEKFYAAFEGYKMAKKMCI